jgi:hypothetical protein
MENGEQRNRFKTFISIMIALAAVTGALVSWQAAQVGGDASAADGQAVTAALEEAGTEINIASDIYSNQLEARQFLFHQENSRMINDQVMRNPTVPNRWLDEWQSEIIRARNHHIQLNIDYLKKEGNKEMFDSRKYHDALRAETAGQKALDPGPFIRRSEARRQESKLLVFLNTLFTAAIFFFTAAYHAESRKKIVWIAAGIIFYLAGAGLALWQVIV